MTVAIAAVVKAATTATVASIKPTKPQKTQQQPITTDQPKLALIKPSGSIDQPKPPLTPT